MLKNFKTLQKYQEELFLDKIYDFILSIINPLVLISSQRKTLVLITNVRMVELALTMAKEKPNVFVNQDTMVINVNVSLQYTCNKIFSHTLFLLMLLI